MLGATPSAYGASIFWEDFEGYTVFNNQGDPTNPGIPEISEGANEFWYGGRFEFFDNGTINQDLAVQKFRRWLEQLAHRPHGRRGRAAAALEAGYTNVQLDFDWRLFSGGTVDRIVVGYHIGDLGFDMARTASATSSPTTSAGTTRPR